MYQVSGAGATITPVTPPAGVAGWVKKLHVPAYWARGIFGKGVKVAIIDTGIDHRHPALAPAIGSAHNTTSDDPFAWADRHGHGSHVAGIVRQVAPGADLLIIKGLGDGGQGYDHQLAAAIDWAREQGAHIINASWGDSAAPTNTLIEDAINRFEAAGGLFVASAGNDGHVRLELNTVGWPARLPNALAVAATWQMIIDSPYSSAAPYSSAGPEVDITAPGTWIVSCAPGGGWVSLDGTSMAAPIVSAIAALLAEDWLRKTGEPATPVQIRTLLLHHTRDIPPVGRDVLAGVGEVDLVPLAEFRDVALTEGAAQVRIQEQMTLTESSVNLDVPARIEPPGRFFAEFRGLASAMGANMISWDLATRTGRTRLDVIPMGEVPKA